MKLEINLDDETSKNLTSWLEGPYDQESKSILKKWMKSDPKQLIDSMYCRMSFGTGGLRGLCGPGTNRVNLFTIQFATQGLANYLKQQFPREQIRLAIGFDSRLTSHSFAQCTANVLANNGFQVFLFESLRPTPLLSFASRYKKCHAAVMITASHNPKEYNGYKVYWQDGAQILPPHDRGIIEEVYKILSPEQVAQSGQALGSIETMGSEIDQAYQKAILPLQSYPEQNAKHGNSLSLVYTNLHGSGITMLPGGLKAWGFDNLIHVDEQKEPDGNFPTVSTPNPEEQKALLLGIQKLLEEQADLLIGTDADADRLGAVVNHHGKAVLLNGNQIACICLYHLLQAKKQHNQLSPSLAFVKTIVTTELFRKIVESYGCTCVDVLTGFKYIGEKIRQWEESGSHQFCFGGEESYGYLLGTLSRDKDATISAALLAEVTLDQKLKGHTLVDLLHEIYRSFGVYRESLESIVLTGREGQEAIQKMMEALRQNPPSHFANLKVSRIEDYQQQTALLVNSNTKEDLLLPKSNVLLYLLEDGSKIVVRPSGTEPKIKLYMGTCHPFSGDLNQDIKACDQKLADLLSALKHQFVH